jgi:MFS transporter, putative metabolite:H+ symporter
VLASVGGFVIGFEWTLGIVYVNEMFPTEIRATGFGWSVGLGRIVSIAAPIVTQTLAVSIGVAHVIQLSAFIWLSLILGYWLSHETRGTEIVDRVVKRSEMAPAMPALGAGSGTESGPRGLVRTTRLSNLLLRLTRREPRTDRRLL